MRFPGYCSPWASKPFSLCFDYLSNNALSRECLNYSGGDLKNIHYGDVLIKLPAVVSLSDNRIPFINDNIDARSDTLKRGDVVIADTAEDYEVGKALEILSEEGFQAVAGLHTIPCRPKTIFAPGYLAYYFGSPAYKKRLSPLIQGIKVYGISKRALSALPIIFPTIEEQAKISGLLIALDQRIETQNKIINAISSLINPLFDAYHQNLEAKRFSLCDLAVIKKGEQVNADMMNEENEIPMLNGGTSPSGFFTKSNRGADTIAISEGGNSCGYISFMIAPFWAGGHCYTVHPINRQMIHNRYLYFLLKRQETRIMALRVGSGLPNIQRKDLESFSLSVPSLDQQERIAQKLDIVTSKLSLERELLDSLRHLKQFLLANLFI